MNEFVWIVDDYSDRVTKRDRLKAQQQEASRKAMGFGCTMMLLSEEDAFNYLVIRAQDKLVEANKEVQRAKKRLAKCQKLFATVIAKTEQP